MDYSHYTTAEDIQEFNNNLFPIYKKAEYQILQENDTIIQFRHINEELKEYFSRNYIFGEGQTPDVPVEEQSNYYRKHLDDDTYMCMRVSNHDVDIYKTYLQFNRGMIPSTNPFANICLMFNGINEDGRSFAFRGRPEKKLPTLYVTLEELQQYQDFDYTVYHFIPGLFKQPDIIKLAKAINEWFKNNGNKEIDNPFDNKIYNIRRSANSPVRQYSLNPLASIYKAKVYIQQKTVSESISFYSGEKYEVADFIVKDASENENKYVMIVEIISILQRNDIELPEKTMEEIQDDYLRQTWGIPKYNPKYNKKKRRFENEDFDED